MNSTESAGDPGESRHGHRDLTGYSAKAHAWRAFVETSGLITDRMEKRLQATTGLRLSDYNVLLLLAEARDHQLRMGELAERMIFSPSRASYQVKSLESRGLIVRSTDPDDRRGMTARLTDRGHRVFHEASALHGRHIKQLFHPALDDDQAAALQTICDQLTRHVRETEDES